MNGQSSGARMRRIYLVVAFPFVEVFLLASGVPESLYNNMTASGRKKQYHIYPMADRMEGISHSALRAWNGNVCIGHIE